MAINSKKELVLLISLTYGLLINADIVGGLIERMTGMMTDELMAVLQDHDSSDGMATKQFLIT